MRRLAPLMLLLLVAVGLAACSSVSARGGAQGGSNSQRSGGFLLGSGITF